MKKKTCNMYKTNFMKIFYEKKVNKCLKQDL